MGRGGKYFKKWGRDWVKVGNHCFKPSAAYVKCDSYEIF